MPTIDEVFMQEAIRQAQMAFLKDEVPVGAVIVHQNKVIARAYNQVELLKDPTAHAEMLAITQATSFLSSKWLQECTMYVTIEPCSMCAGALVLARIKRLCFGAGDPKTGGCGSIVNIADHEKLNHRIEIKRAINEAQCGSLLSEFFQKKRKQAQELTN
ncbi:MAG: tRNA adenosine(34) deaminase TadA [Candidatus Omnitrophota bacterium]